MKKKDQISKEYKLKIGGNIRKWRNLKGIKQKELASTLSLSEAAVSNIENNITDVTLSQLEDISLGLDVSVEQLFSDPQENYFYSALNTGKATKPPVHVLEKDLLNAVISSMQKKDEQLQTIMQDVLLTMSALMGNGSHREPVISSKPQPGKAG